ncbi:MAG: 50S ribosomal protein L23 [Methanofollis liminatans]|jgi:large subunit ribosomal protein L23|uniref:Large ribosomal subunit protein uL23 n=3 Tax=Methanofollis TaxID=81416 RepID=A0A7K4HNB0_9EURY|nr:MULTISPECIES: 50S ribosomal protein L23 [Methanofollis]EJG06415.1 ribosomal protein L23 [Methanofollis liminatans DSM 4140]MDD3110971.1 50S ribosomal protein L23 [Methanofollis liminatans]NVO66642.1 50S ribosomal protein L23 [Methanofollis tationis]HDS62830.1 50S ribosomal protein L23 [Methanofollis liminatans]
MVLRHPYVTEKAMMMLENENKVQVLVQKSASKDEIRREIEKTFDQKVASVRTMMTMKGQKKAVVSFENEKAAEEILSRLGVM